MELKKTLKQLAQEYLDKHYFPDLVKALAFRACKDDVFECCCDILMPQQVDLAPTFSQKLFELIKKHNVSETDCYKNANLDRRLFSKIRSNDDYQPSKNTVFALIFGLKLNLKEANELLEAAGYSVSHSIKMDVLIEFLIKRRIYDISVVNDILYEHKCNLLGNVTK
ncbi:MAG: hypothetical protein MJ187_02615 [Alphaproteobacteria bacterium]|nr:hypothetical protein [Alphaproteobacteria bacterium]